MGNNPHDLQVHGTSHSLKNAIVQGAGHNFHPIHYRQRLSDGPRVVFQFQVLKIPSVPSYT